MTTGTLSDLEAGSDVNDLLHEPQSKVSDHEKSPHQKPQQQQQQQSETKPDCLDPRNHQHLPVLSISYSQKSVHFPYPCTPIYLYDWNFYEDSYYRDFNTDRTLGCFLDYYAFRYIDECETLCLYVCFDLFL